jgi:hypothetical protein
VTQVREAGTTMAEIVNSSRQVTQIMGEVVQTSLAQSARLREVTDDLTAQDVSAKPWLRSSRALPCRCRLGSRAGHDRYQECSCQRLLKIVPGPRIHEKGPALQLAATGPCRLLSTSGQLPAPA